MNAQVSKSVLRFQSGCLVSDTSFVSTLRAQYIDFLPLQRIITRPLSLFPFFFFQWHKCYIRNRMSGKTISVSLQKILPDCDSQKQR